MNLSIFIHKYKKSYLKHNRHYFCITFGSDLMCNKILKDKINVFEAGELTDFVYQKALIRTFHTSFLTTH